MIFPLALLDGRRASSARAFLPRAGTIMERGPPGPLSRVANSGSRMGEIGAAAPADSEVRAP